MEFFCHFSVPTAAVSNVNISGPFTAVEYRTVQLNCTSLGGNVSYFWFKDNQLVEAGDCVVLSDKNETLMFTHINRNDTANYVCQGVNRFSSQFSEAHRLEVFYGPDRPVIKPQESVYNEGSNLSLSCLADSNPSANYAWWFNDELLEDQYGSQLLILDLLKSSAGNYTCNATNNHTGYSNASSLEISILAAVSDVTITGPSTPVEYHTVQLNCTSLGGHVSYYWFKDDQLVEAGDRVSLSDKNKTLTFTSSNRNDTGSYVCQAVNDFSSESSEPYWLDILYGPDRPVIEPQESVYNEGSTVNLSCLADSNPSANYAWWFNDELLEDQSGSQLLVLDLLESNAGNYTCRATNDHTGYSNASSLEISIVAAVSNVNVSGPSTAVEDHTVQLNCTSLGGHVSYYWFKDNQLVEAGGRVSLSDKNETLTFTPSNRNDAASYVCRGVNDFSSQYSAPYRLTIFSLVKTFHGGSSSIEHVEVQELADGPDSPLIEPQESVYNEGSSLSLSCFADSNPPANYSWWFNDQQQEDQYGSLFLIPQLLKSNAGNYTCKATNDRTAYSSSSSLEISILAAVSNVTITGPSTPVEYHTVQLNCTSLGGHVSYYWFKGDQLVEAGDRVSLSDKNETLIFTSSNRNDTGNYTCQGVNDFSFQSSEPYWLDIFYGPDSPLIEPQKTIYNEGSTLNLSCFADSNPSANYAWWFNDEPLEDQYGSQLLILDLLESNAGNYTCRAINDHTAYSNTSSLEISILAAVSNVTISGPSTPVEYHTVQLTCTSLGSHVFYSWLKGNQLVEPGDRVFLSDQNKTLTFTPSSRNDTANYVCQAVNDFSSESSEPYRLDIFYGPDRPVIEPQESVYNEGSTLNLSCLADSNPSANYAWWFNDELLEDQYGSQLLIPDLLESNAGNYTCNATNDHTSYSNTSSLEISIVAAVSNVIISGPSTPVEYHTVQLTCTSLGGHVFYSWLKGNQLVEPGDRVFLSDQNKTLTFTPSSRNDTANYVCQAVNDFSSESSEPFWLDILYGPDRPVIEPQESVYNEGSTLNFSCLADSNPSANYSWWFNDELLEDQSGSQLLILDLLESNAGNYTCRATNNHTGYSNASSLEISILERVSNVSITSHPAKVIENELTVLTCSSVGTNVSYVWSKGGQTLESAGHISVNYSSLTFNPTWRNDTGSYTCYGHNSFSNSSATYPLKVFYGPAVPIISPQQYDYAEGSAFTLHCRADSLPPPEYTWSFNGSEFPEKSPQLSIPSLSFDMAGNYTCSAFNSETNLSSSSTLKIRVLEKVFNVSIQGPSETTENDSVNLTCSSRGSEVSYTWFKENQTLEDGGHILLWGPNHEMLTLNPVQRSDAGSYTCRGNNSVSDDTSDPFPLDVFYGPDDPIITPQEHNYLQGKDLNLRCQADSKPVAQYTWFFNEMEEIGNGSQLLIPGLSFNNSGNYTCNATNIKTGTSRATVWEIRVLGSY
uniref:Uncharacterized protein n=1 Tax=Sphaerodactylus townsendi TaxID=933632 RepID=A0ACB8FSN0_9SAUR